jgi:hypothetical protein
MESEGIIRALREVPEVRLRLIELARELFQDGRLDEERAAFLRREIDEAIVETQEYAQATREAVWALTETLR